VPDNRDDPPECLSTAVLTGNRDADLLEELLVNLRPRFIRLYHGMGCGRDAEDLAQDACLKILKRADRIPADAAYRRGWALRVAINCGLDYLRRRAREQQVLRHVANQADRYPEFETSLLDDLKQALSGLSDDHRQVVYLRYSASLSVTEIAAALQLKPSTVRQRLSRAVRRLRASATERGR
jgi:RNA polymerase sigma-70 factor (ECF subfamily)